MCTSRDFGGTCFRPVSKGRETIGSTLLAPPVVALETPKKSDLVTFKRIKGWSTSQPVACHTASIAAHLVRALPCIKQHLSWPEPIAALLEQGSVELGTFM